MSRYRLVLTPAQEMALRALGRVEMVDAAFTSQRCSACGQVDAKSRESLGCLEDALVA